MGSIHSQLLPSPKSVSGWGSAPDPPIARESAFALASLKRWREGRQFPSSPQAPETSVRHWVQALMRQKAPNGRYIHCAAHVLNLVMML